MPLPLLPQELLDGLWGSSAFKRGEVEAVSRPTGGSRQLAAAAGCAGTSWLLWRVQLSWCGGLPLIILCRRSSGQVVRDMLGGAAATPHTHGGAEAADGCPACGAAAVDAEPAAKVYLALRR